MAHQLDQDIASAEADLKAAQAQAEAIVSELKGATSNYLAQWAQYLVDRALGDKPEVAQAMPVDNLRVMKAEFNSLVAQIPAQVVSAFDTEVFWPHRADLPKDIRTNFGASLEMETKHKNSIDQTIRSLIGSVGALLVANGFDARGSGSSWQPDTKGGLRYAYGLPSHPGLETGIILDRSREKYDDALRKFYQAAKKLQELLHAKSGSQAKDLWDKS